VLNGFGWPHLLIIALLIIILFGAKRLPDAARGIGKSMRIFKAETRGLHEDDAQASGAAPGNPPAPTPPQQLSAPQQPYVAPTTAEQAKAQGEQQH
jgi:sec-independent protein translocase protein TatA